MSSYFKTLQLVQKLGITIEGPRCFKVRQLVVLFRWWLLIPDLGNSDSLRIEIRGWLQWLQHILLAVCVQHGYWQGCRLVIIAFRLILMFMSAAVEPKQSHNEQLVILICFSFTVSYNSIYCIYCLRRKTSCTNRFGGEIPRWFLGRRAEQKDIDLLIPKMQKRILCLQQHNQVLHSKIY